MEKCLVIGGGLVATIFAEDDRFELCPHTIWRQLNLEKFDAIVNAAGLNMESKCLRRSMREVAQANVMLPLDAVKFAKARGLPVLNFSTGGVYEFGGVRTEDDDLKPHNRYVASKVAMESLIACEGYEKSFVFRLPFVCRFNNHPSDLSGRVRGWEQCEDVNASVVYEADLRNAAIEALEGARGGIYNIASGTFHFPTFLEDRLDWRGEVVPAHSMGKTPNAQLNTAKAFRAGLL